MRENNVVKSQQKLTSPGTRIRWLRNEELRLTQEQFARALEMHRTTVNKVESDVQKPSASMLDAMRRVYGISSDWIKDGYGVAFISRAASVNPSAVSGKNATTVATVREAPVAYVNPEQAAQSRSLVRRLAPNARDQVGRFGYMLLSGNTRVRLHAARDSKIQNTEHLLHIVEEDNLWAAFGDIKGWEFEVLREYLEDSGDRDLEYWAEALRFIRWIAGRIATVENFGELADEARR